MSDDAPAAVDVVGLTKTFNAGPFTKAGVFAFHCEIHPDRMSGAFVVK